MQTLAERFNPSRNNIDVIRLVAAMLVLVSHSWPLTGREVDPVSRLTGGIVGGGTLSVVVFFVLSGFLVTKSMTERTVGDYLASRALRIVPALALVSVFDAAVIGAIFTSLPLGDYAAHPTTLNHLLNFLVFPTEFDLPGVFAGTPYPHVNGSLWTLPIESFLYLCLPLLLVTGLLTRRWTWGVVLAVAILVIYQRSWLGLSDANRGRLVFASVQEFHLATYGLFFFLGGAAYVYCDKVPLSGGLVLLAFVFLYGSRQTAIASAVFFVAVTYVTLYLAVAFERTVSVRRIGDLSYGIYIFAWPIQKSVLALLPGAGPRTLTAIALPAAIALAYLSWHLVEKRALRLRRRV